MVFNSNMNTFSNARKDIYIAKKNKNATYDDYNNEIVTYEKPFYLGKKNYQPLTGKELTEFISVYGETQNKLVQCLVDCRDGYLLNNFDLAYLYGANPATESVNGQYANYKIRAIREQNTKTMVILEEIIKEV